MTELGPGVDLQVNQLVGVLVVVGRSSIGRSRASRSSRSGMLRERPSRDRAQVVINLADSTKAQLFGGRSEVTGRPRRLPRRSARSRRSSSSSPRPSPATRRGSGPTAASPATPTPTSAWDKTLPRSLLRRFASLRTIPRPRIRVLGPLQRDQRSQSSPTSSGK